LVNLKNFSSNIAFVLEKMCADYIYYPIGGSSGLSLGFLLLFSDTKE
jgi:hypothetical protein